MSDQIKMNYPLMEEMAKTFQQGAEQLKQSRTEMQTLATQMNDGALLGRGGATFVDAIQGKLCPSIDRLSAKFEELQADVLQAMNEMKEADRAAGKLYT